MLCMNSMRKKIQAILLENASNAFNLSAGKHFSTILVPYALLLKDVFEIVTIFLTDFSSLVEGKFNILKGQLKVIPILWQFTQ